MALSWDAPGNVFRMDRPEGVVTFRRRPIIVHVSEAKAEGGGRSIVVRAKVEVVNARRAPARMLVPGVRRRRSAGPRQALTASADPDGLLRLVVPFRPPYDATVYKTFPVVVPFAELPEESAGRELRFTLGVWCWRDKAEALDTPAWTTSSQSGGNRSPR